mmetsp:Transcript_1850/g.2143  ORF Transcript_1850/g.2143 Transcript_1850/m.2143 type:complete len:120 (-) Transcript_1850:37-396(-)
MAEDEAVYEEILKRSQLSRIRVLNEELERLRAETEEIEKERRRVECRVEGFRSMHESCIDASRSQLSSESLEEVKLQIYKLVSAYDKEVDALNEDRLQEEIEHLQRILVQEAMKNVREK